MKSFTPVLAASLALCLLAAQPAFAANSGPRNTTHIFLPAIASGDGDPTIGFVNGGLPANYSPSKEALAHIAQKTAVAERAWRDHLSNMSPQGVFYGVPTGYYQEPNLYAYRNYCGPSATQVALSARLPSWQIPSIDTIGTEENIDPTWGVYMSAVVKVLNKRLNTTWYEVSVAGNFSTFSNHLTSDLTMRYAMVTGLQVTGLNGWGKSNAFHIVTVYNSYSPWGGASSLGYADTVSPAAGYNGNYDNVMDSYTFYTKYVSKNDVQAW